MSDKLQKESWKKNFQDSCKLPEQAHKNFVIKMKETKKNMCITMFQWKDGVYKVHTEEL